MQNLRIKLFLSDLIPNRLAHATGFLNASPKCGSMETMPRSLRAAPYWFPSSLYRMYVVPVSKNARFMNRECLHPLLYRMLKNSAKTPNQVYLEERMVDKIEILHSFLNANSRFRSLSKNRRRWKPNARKNIENWHEGWKISADDSKLVRFFGNLSPRDFSVWWLTCEPFPSFRSYEFFLEG